MEREFPFDPEGAWVIAKGYEEDEFFIVRFREDVDPKAGSRLLPRLLVIEWSYFAEPGHDGLPSTTQLHELKVMEDRLVNALQVQKLALLVSAYTSAGVRRWMWYCGDGDAPAIEKAINVELRGEPSFPITLRVSDDPEWSHYASLQALL